VSGGDEIERDAMMRERKRGRRILPRDWLGNGAGGRMELAIERVKGHGFIAHIYIHTYGHTCGIRGMGW
jgi:hypothetical protein